MKIMEMTYYEVEFETHESIAIRTLIPNMTVAEATVFVSQFKTTNLLKKFDEIISLTIIPRPEVTRFYDDSCIDKWPIAVRSDTLWNEYKKYQTQWMIEHGYTIRDLIDYLIEFDREWGDDIDFQTLYNDWIHDSGFGGEIWACFDEWKETEGEGKIFINVDEKQ